MSSVVLDSEPVFEERAKVLGATREELEVMKETGWNTFGRLAADGAQFTKLAATITASGASEPPEEGCPSLVASSSRLSRWRQQTCERGSKLVAMSRLGP